MTFTKLYNHWLNPLGNYREPFPFPERRIRDAEESWLGRKFGTVGMYIWWHLRNKMTNFNSVWIGIVPVREYGGDKSEHVASCYDCVWQSPEVNGWERYHASNGWYHEWRKGLIRLPYIKNKYFALGWKSRGSLGGNLYLDNIWKALKTKVD